jgi:hypothetical protein
MNNHDFTDVYETCGPLMESQIKKYMDFKQWSTEICSPKKAESYLLSLDIHDFNKLYINMPRDIEGYQTNADELYDSDDDDNHCSYFEYAGAFVSNIELLRKCLAISNIPINNSIKMYIQKRNNFGYPHFYYKDINVNSCKLLHEHGCDMIGLLYIAYCVQNYECIKYIINNMSSIELSNYITNEYIYFDLINILVIDRIKHDKVLLLLLHDKLMTNIEYDNDIIIIIKCYYIITCLTIDEGKILMEKQTKMFASRLRKAYYGDLRCNIEMKRILHNDLLAYHFKV